MAGRYGGRSSNLAGARDYLQRQRVMTSDFKFNVDYAELPKTTRKLVGDASASAGLDLRYDTIEKDPWLVVVWPQGTEKRFATKQEAFDYIKQLDASEFWNPGRGAARDRDRVR